MEGNNPENQILAYKTRLRATAAPGCSAAPGGAQMEGGGRRAAPRPALSAGEESSFFSKSTASLRAAYFAPVASIRSP